MPIFNKNRKRKKSVERKRKKCKCMGKGGRERFKSTNMVRPKNRFGNVFTSYKEQKRVQRKTVVDKDI